MSFVEFIVFGVFMWLLGWYQCGYEYEKEKREKGWK